GGSGGGRGGGAGGMMRRYTQLLTRYIRPPKFNWNPAKEQANLEKHGLSFPEVIPVWLDQDRLDLPSPRSHCDEPRRITIGDAHGSIRAVVYVMRGGLVWVISARAASRLERR